MTTASEKYPPAVLRVIAGDAAFAEYGRLRDAAKIQRDQFGRLNSGQLCDLQRDLNRAGFLEASIVKSIYGYSVRYASGLQNFDIIASARRGQLDGTFEDAVRYARAWAAEDPDRRFVTTWERN